jgi:superfamily II DNA/RNA helicase
MIIDAFVIRSEDKISTLFWILEKIVEGKAIVFVSTRYHVDYLVALVGLSY